MKSLENQVLSLNKEVEQVSSKSIAQSISTLGLIKEQRILFEKNQHKDMQILLNFVQFSVISSMDFQVLLRRYFSSDLSWESNFNSRVLALCVYEFIIGVKELKNKEFVTALSKVIGDVNSNGKWKELVIELRNFEKSNVNSIRVIRHNVIGHKHKDAKVQLELIESMNIEEFKQLNLDVMKLVANLHVFMIDVFEKMPLK